MICAPCLTDDCGNCVDIVLIALGKSPACQCKKAEHDGEPIKKQILDPETGTVHAPGLEVNIGGEVKFCFSPKKE